MSVSMEEVKSAQEEIKSVLTGFQKTVDGIQNEGNTNKETMQNMQKALEEFSENYQNTVGELQAETKAREELELAMSKIKFKSSDGAEGLGSPEYKKAFNDYLKKRLPISEEIKAEEFKELVKYETGGMELDESEMSGLKTLLVGSNPDGGYLVPVERQSVIKKRMFETTPMRQLASIYSIATEATEFVLDDEEFDSLKVGELDTRANTDTSQIGIITIATKEQYAMPVATQKIVDDAVFNVDAWIIEKISKRFSRVENAENINGSGVNQMQGLATVPSWAQAEVYERGALWTRAITGTGGTTIAANDLLDLQSDLLEDYQSNAHWMFHRKLWVEIMKLVDGNGQYLLNPQMLFAGVSPQLLGKPVMMSGDMPNAIAGDEDQIIGYYGDFREGYALVDRIGVRILKDPYTTKGVIKYYATKRTGGGIVNFQSIKRLGVVANT